MNAILNQYKGRKKVIQGWNEALATSNEHISAQSLAWAESGGTNLNASFGAGTVLEIASASANDTSEGTGARKIKVIGAKGATGETIEEEITLNGQTSVNSVNKFQLVYAAHVSAVGTGKANAGIIGISVADSTNTSGVLTAPTPALTIPAGDNHCCSCVYMAEPEEGMGKKCKLKKIIYGVSTQPVVVTIYVRDATLGVWFKKKVVPLGNVMGNEINVDNEEIILGAGDVIRADALSTTVAGRIFLQLEMETIIGGAI